MIAARLRSCRMSCALAFPSMLGLYVSPAPALSDGWSPEHPFMIVREGEYDSLRAKSERWPWSVMKRRAIDRAMTLSYDSSVADVQKALSAYDLGSSCALAYILDPGNRETYVTKVRVDVQRLLHDVRMGKEHSPDPAGHGSNVTPAHAAFMGYLVLDIMHDDLETSVRTSMENDCDYVAGRHAHSWLASKFAIEGMKALYHQGAGKEFQEYAGRYRDYLLNNTSEDGVYTTGPGYAHSRLFMEQRAQKKIFMDVCEYQGLHEFYSEPRFRKLHEWLFGYTVSPFNRTSTFGDSPPTKEFDEFSTAVLRADRFSPTAAGYACWYMGVPSDASFTGGLLQYLLCSSRAFEPIMPVSRIFRSGGAWLLQDECTAQSMAGVLWNVTTVNESHSHYDANAIAIDAFGEHILRNSGYDGWNEPDSSRWQWIHRNALSSNTLTVGNSNHEDFRGGGIVDGIVGLPVQFATGESGPSLGQSSDDRSLLFVQPTAGLPGYFALVDEVLPQGSDMVSIVLHPNSDKAPRVMTALRRYEWRIKNCFSDKSLRVAIVHVTKPDSVSLVQGYLGSNEECNRFSDVYLRSAYNVPDQRISRIATLIVPFTASAPSPTVFGNDGYSGVRLSLDGNISDVLVVPTHGTGYTSPDITFSASFAWWRVDGDTLAYYAVREGTKFRTAAGWGFDSETPVSIIVCGNRGTMITRGTSASFQHPRCTRVFLDGTEISLRGTFAVPAGTHTMSFER